MKSLFFYLLQVVVVSGILYAYYYVALRNKKFHQYNRFYILGATLASILIPFLNIPVYFSNDDASAQWLSALQSLYGQPVVIAVGTTPIEEESIFTLQNLVYALYALIGFAGLSKIIFSVYRLKKIMRQHPAEHLNGIRFINTAEPGTPFSFFRWLFWNNRIELSSQKGEQIFRHEIFHIEQKHSLDTVFMEMVSIVFWINPFFHIMKKELKAIHEFLADRFASSETEKWEYAEMLLMQALNTQHSLVHPFFHNQIKRRIAMITNPQKTSHQYLRKLLVLPLAALLITLFAFSYKQKQDYLTIEDMSIAETTSPARDTMGISEILTKEYRNNDVSVQADTVIIDPARIKKNKPEPSLIIFNNKQYSRKEFGDLLSQQPSKNMTVNADVVIERPANDRNALAKYGEIARDGVLEFQQASFDTVPDKKRPTFKITGTALTQEKKPLIVLDGVIKEDKDYQNTLAEINPHDIESISVLKDASAESQYGSKGKDGVLVINTKSNGLTGKLQPVRPDLQEVVVTGVGVKKARTDSAVSFKLSNVQIDKPKTIRGNVQEVAIEDRKSKPEEVTVVGFGIKKSKDSEIREEPVERAAGRLVSNKLNVNLSSGTGLDVEPAFPGGATAWYNFLVRNLDRGTPLKKGAPEGQYTVFVRMKVDKDGRLSDFKALTSHGFGMEDAAIRALEKSPYWNPGYKNGVAVNSYKTQPIVFVVAGEKVEQKGELPETTATIYPNPVKDNLTVQFNSKTSRTATIKIIDMNGKTYTRANLKLAKGLTTSTISTADLAPGTYLLRVQGEKNDEDSTFKFVKE